MAFYTGGLSPDHYDDQRLVDAIDLLKDTQTWLAGRAVIAVHHPHRFWEWGKAIAACRDVLGRLPTSALDVGAGHGLLGPTLALEGAEVIEPEIDPYAVHCRQHQVNPLLVELGKIPIETPQIGFGALPERSFELVCSVSVIEHLPAEIERPAWLEMGSRVAVGGVLYVTIDIMDDPSVAKVSDDARGTKFTLSMLRERAEDLVAHGFSYLDEPDWTYQGDFVYDYSFGSLAMRRDR